ncbi:MAG TPA: MarR family transcriptional regulator [Oleiagrimonas sp.]|nr:MarR family transcriptional regulator [Oleiagrimonas sp.]
MHPFHATERRVDRTCSRFPDFPRDPALLVRLIKRIAQTVHDAGNGSLRKHGINHTDYNILMMLYGSEDYASTPSELAAAAGEKLANITRVCNALCDKKLIHRAPSAEDRRKVTVRLSARGERFVEGLLPDMAGLLHRSVRGLDAREQATLETLLKKMLVDAERMGDAP